MSMERRKSYPFEQFEPKWQRAWDEQASFHAPNPGEPGFDPAKPKFYVLDMFPYPSGAGLHVGHPVGYLATDTLARYKRMRGFNVLHPMGWDAFGLPAEQYAIKTGQHPATTTAQNIAGFKGQLKRIGFAYDWPREVNTTDPGYYKWTQWIFLTIYHSWLNPGTQRAEPISTYQGIDPDSVRLAYVAEVPVNWCPELGTVLANEEVVDGRSEVGGFPVVRKPMRQWMLRITAYAERLINELEGLDWPESIKLMQRNWIGRSEGAEVDFKVAPASDSRAAEGAEPEACPTIRVFTTRPDTLYGATYMVLAPEHPLVDLVTTEEQWPAVRDYREKTARKSDLERTELSREKSGVWTGACAINPVNEERIPIWIADYVLLGYGTGAIMAVPAHDERDWEFARKFHLPVREVVSPTPALGLGGSSPCSAEPLECFVGEGFAVHSGPLDGLPTPEAKREITRRLEELGLGQKTINYKLRDWLFSRQRYWGEPFPIVWENGRHRALEEHELPLVPPPLDDFKPTGTGEPPLAKATDWVRYGKEARRETNTMPQWAGSCWYYLRYCDPKNVDCFVGREAERYWMGASRDSAGQPARPKPGGVDLYVGGTEHAVLHLLYARFWHKVLFDLGHVSTPEPFQRLVNQGLILGEDGQKMSKARGNVVNPDDVIAEYGADALRCYEMFMGPLEATKPWSMSGVEGVARFLARVWRLVMEENDASEWVLGEVSAEAAPDKAQNKVIHATIKKVGEDIEALSFNTAIAEMMKFVNAFTNVSPRPVPALRVLLQLLNPFAPHLTSELWEILSRNFPGPRGDLADQPWPAYDPQMLIEDELEFPVQVNGKLRDKIVVHKDASTAEIEAAALAAPKAGEHRAGKTVKKIVVVPGRLVNIVVA
ncbi:MAG: leucine--tRNA ligase [Verrucomicrobiota bacterium]|nr:leucine--tRNA ligase [Verrucomicrobiota bacterium]